VNSDLEKISDFLVSSGWQRACPWGVWWPIETAPEGKPVLLTVESLNGRRRVIRAMRAGEHTLPLSDDQDPWDGCLYDEDEDCHYCTPGWYEKNENEECNWGVSDTAVAWMPLPVPPIVAAAPKISHELAAVMLDSLDDCARMDCGIDATGPREILKQYIEQQRAITPK